MSIPTLLWVFFRVGATGFGDVGPLLVVVERELVERRGVLTHDDITESLTYTRLLPGSNVVLIVSYLAYRLAGWPGSALATAAYILPSAVVMAFLAAGYLAASSLPAIGPAVIGLTAAVVGVLLATTYRIGRRNLVARQPITIVIALLAFLAGAVLGVHVAAIAVTGGLLGVLLLAPRGVKTTSAGG
ncbi:MAG: chromate transporter [Chloroflexi bacterium]|nr:chromate transporter [Chloroflexota bacterium]